AGVGAAGAAHEHGLAGHVADGVLQGRLDGPLVYLPLPAREIRAVVLDDDAKPAARNWNMSPSDQLVSPTCRRSDIPSPEMSACGSWKISDVWLPPITLSKPRAASGSSQSSTSASPAAACQPRVPPRPWPPWPSLAISPLPSVICQYAQSSPSLPYGTSGMP